MEQIKLFKDKIRNAVNKIEEDLILLYHVNYDAYSTIQVYVYSKRDEVTVEGIMNNIYHCIYSSYPGFISHHSFWISGMNEGGEFDFREQTFHQCNNTASFDLICELNYDEKTGDYVIVSLDDTDIKFTLEDLSEEIKNGN